jgi:hypothetical protein
MATDTPERSRDGMSGGHMMNLFTVIALVSVVLAGAIIWLVLTSPVTVANAVSEGDVTPLVRELAAELLKALEGLLKYL